MQKHFVGSTLVLSSWKPRLVHRKCRRNNYSPDLCYIPPPQVPFSKWRWQTTNPKLWEISSTPLLCLHIYCEGESRGVRGMGISQSSLGMHHWVGSSRVTPCFGVCSFMINLPAALGLFNSLWEFLFIQTGIELSPPWWLYLLSCANTQLRLSSIPVSSCAFMFIWGFSLPCHHPLSTDLVGFGVRMQSSACSFLSPVAQWMTSVAGPRAAMVPNPPLNLGRASFLLPNYLYWILRAWTWAPETLQMQDLAPYRLQPPILTQSSGSGSPTGAKNCRNPTNSAQNVPQTWQTTGILQQETEPKGIWGQENSGMPGICSV